jgi:Cdc6-like AAA superfamily ATPase
MLTKNVAADGTTNHTFWVDDSRILYKSDKFLVRKSYKDIAEIIMKESVQHPKEEGIDILVSGSPGTGKSFFARFFLWQLLHPSPGVSSPEMIIWHCCRRGRITGWIFYKGQFFFHEDIDHFT